MSKELVCLKCTLFDCDEKDPNCLYRALTSRSAYYKLYYRLNRARLKKQKAEYQKRTEYWKRLDRREYFKARYARMKAIS